MPVEVTKDGSSLITCHETQEFSRKYNIHHQVSTVGTLHANLRSKLAVKSLKCLLREYVSGGGCIDNDSVTMALLAYEDEQNYGSNRRSMCYLINFF